MSNRAVSMYITVEAFFGDSEASSLPGPCNRDLKCDDSVDSTAQSLDVFGAKAKSACKKNMFQHVSTAQTCCCSMGEDCI